MTGSNRRPMPMFRRLSGYLLGRLLPWLLAFALIPALAQNTADKVRPVDPRPQDTGAAGLKQMLLRLHTTARLLHTTAHPEDRKSTRLNSSHVAISYAVFCLKKKK